MHAPSADQNEDQNQAEWRAVIRGIFAMSAAQQNRCRLDIQPPGLNIYASQSRTENARTCRRPPVL